MQESGSSGIKSFKDLFIWQEARALRKDVYLLVAGFPVEERYRLSDQMIRCSRSVGNNIAEGYGRYHYQEFIQFCRHSRGSLEELKDHFVCALDCGFIDYALHRQYNNRIDILLRKLNSFINYLKSKKQAQG